MLVGGTAACSLAPFSVTVIWYLLSEGLSLAEGGQGALRGCWGPGGWLPWVGRAGPLKGALPAEIFPGLTVPEAAGDPGRLRGPLLSSRGVSAGRWAPSCGAVGAAAGGQLCSPGASSAPLCPAARDSTAPPGFPEFLALS